ncbi:MAG TPA: hypothetical protein VGJ06_06035 [Candidatus Acidoferrum sp.]
MSRELKRCRKCSVFSGADVTMRVRCGSTERFVRSAILDRDIFGSRSNTPKNTSWSMDLVGRLDHAVGPGVMERPAVSNFTNRNVSIHEGPESAAERDAAAGEYDALFGTSDENPSTIYRQAQQLLPAPEVSLRSSAPVSPVSVVLPAYSPLGRATQFSGLVFFTLDVDRDGVPSNFEMAGGPPFMRAEVEQAALQWRFPKDLIYLHVTAAISYASGCKKKE